MNTGVTRDENGTYHWIGKIDTGYDKKVLKILFGGVGTACIIFIVLCLAMDVSMLKVTMLSCLGVMAVVAAVAIPMTRMMSGRQQAYEMNDEHIRFVGYGRQDTIFAYRDIRKVRVYYSRDMLEIKGLLVTAPFFVPHEDFGFVRDYVLRRLPGNTEVVYE